MDAGNFAPAGRSPGDSAKARSFLDLYQRMNYDAVALSSRELAYGLAMWEEAAQKGCPIVAANLFEQRRVSALGKLFGQSSRKPIFTQSVIRDAHGERLAVIGLVSSAAWKARTDTSIAVAFRSPHDMGDLIRATAKKCDHLTIVGEFSQQEAESLVTAFSGIDMVVSSGIKNDAPKKVKQAVIVGVGSRGYNGNYVEWDFAKPDDANNFVAKAQSLDPAVPEDTSMVRALGMVNERIRVAAQGR